MLLVDEQKRLAPSAERVIEALEGPACVRVTPELFAEQT